MRRCADCGELKDESNMTDVRADVCKSCFVVRGNVIEAMKQGKMTMTDFKNYQRHGLRIKRLIKMGYSNLVKGE